MVPLLCHQRWNCRNIFWLLETLLILLQFAFGDVASSINAIGFCGIFNDFGNQQPTKIDVPVINIIDYLANILQCTHTWLGWGPSTNKNQQLFSLICYGAIYVCLPS